MMIDVNYQSSELKAEYKYINYDVKTGKTTHGLQFDPFHIEDYGEAIREFVQVASNYAERLEVRDDQYV